MKNKTKRKLVVKVISIASAFLIKKATQKIINVKPIKKVSRKSKKTKSQNWSKALAYAAISGAALGAFKLIIEKAANDKLQKVL